MQKREEFGTIEAKKEEKKRNGKKEEKQVIRKVGGTIGNSNCGNGKSSKSYIYVNKPVGDGRGNAKDEQSSASAASSSMGGNQGARLRKKPKGRSIGNRESDKESKEKGITERKSKRLFVKKTCNADSEYNIYKSVSDYDDYEFNIHPKKKYAESERNNSEDRYSSFLTGKNERKSKDKSITLLSFSSNFLTLTDTSSEFKDLRSRNRISNNYGKAECTVRSYSEKDGKKYHTNHKCNINNNNNANSNVISKNSIAEDESISNALRPNKTATLCFFGLLTILGFRNKIISSMAFFPPDEIGYKIFESYKKKNSIKRVKEEEKGKLNKVVEINKCVEARKKKEKKMYNKAYFEEEAAEENVFYITGGFSPLDVQKLLKCSNSNLHLSFFWLNNKILKKEKYNRNIYDSVYNICRNDKRQDLTKDSKCSSSYNNTVDTKTDKRLKTEEKSNKRTFFFLKNLNIKRKERKRSNSVLDVNNNNNNDDINNTNNREALNDFLEFHLNRDELINEDKSNTETITSALISNKPMHDNDIHTMDSSYLNVFVKNNVKYNIFTNKIACILLRHKNKNLLETPLIIFSHGNSTDIGYMFSTYYNLCTKVEVNLLAYDYSAYGRSEGVCTEKAIYKNIQCVYNCVTEVLHIPPRLIILYGQSVGSAPTCNLIKNRNFFDLNSLLFSSFSSSNCHFESKIKVGGVVLHSAIASGLRILFKSLYKSPWFDAFRNDAKLRSLRYYKTISEVNAHDLRQKEESQTLATDARSGNCSGCAKEAVKEGNAAARLAGDSKTKNSLRVKEKTKANPMPFFFIHGKNDNQVAFIHSLILRRALLEEKKKRFVKKVKKNKKQQKDSMSSFPVNVSSFIYPSSSPSLKSFYSSSYVWHWWVDEADHNDIEQVAHSEYYRRIKSFVDFCVLKK